MQTAVAEELKRGMQVLREVHECPIEVQERLARAGGLNRFGEPNFRIVWGWSRLGWRGGWWIDHDKQGNETGKRFEMRLEPIYLPPWDRWILEAYRPPEWWGPRWLWELQTTVFAYPPNGIPALAALGAYPGRGDYIFAKRIDWACAKCWAEAREPGLTDKRKAMILGQCMDRQFLQVTPRVADTLAKMVILSRERSQQQIREEIEAMQAISKKVSDELDDKHMAMADEVELSKETIERIERLVAPRIERQLGRAEKWLREATPEMKRAAMVRTGRAWVN